MSPRGVPNNRSRAQVATEGEPAEAIVDGLPGDESADDLFDENGQYRESTPEEYQPRNLTPRDLHNYDGPLYVENLTPSIIVHDDHQGNKMRLGPVWSEERFSSLPKIIATERTFQKLWRRGKVRVSTDPDMEDVLTFHDLRAEKQEQDALEALRAPLMPSASDSNLVLVQCAECGENTTMTKSQEKSGDAPPLCVGHKSLAPFFVATTQFDQKERRPVTKWSRPSMGATVKGAK